MKNYDMEAKLQRFQLWCRTRKFHEETGLKFYKVVAVSVLLYGSESWILTLQQKRTEVAEMRFLRAAADKKRNEVTRQDSQASSLLSTINKYQEKLYVHLGKYEGNLNSTQTLNYRPYGRSRGRPPVRQR
jgi:hypothetical protein